MFADMISEKQTIAAASLYQMVWFKRQDPLTWIKGRSEHYTEHKNNCIAQQRTRQTASAGE